MRGSEKNPRTWLAIWDFLLLCKMCFKMRLRKVQYKTKKRVYTSILVCTRKEPGRCWRGVRWRGRWWCPGCGRGGTPSISPSWLKDKDYLELLFAFDQGLMPKHVMQNKIWEMLLLPKRRSEKINKQTLLPGSAVLHQSHLCWHILNLFYEKFNFGEKFTCSVFCL